jgi:hypothetical protein
VDTLRGYAIRAAPYEEAEFHGSGKALAVDALVGVAQLVFRK